SRERHVDVADLVDGEALADGVDRSERFEDLPQPVRRDAEDLDVEILRRPPHQAIAHPAADDERPPARVPDRPGDLAARSGASALVLCHPVASAFVLPHPVASAFALADPVASVLALADPVASALALADPVASAFRRKSPAHRLFTVRKP